VSALGADEQFIAVTSCLVLDQLVLDHLLQVGALHGQLAQLARWSLRFHGQPAEPQPRQSPELELIGLDWLMAFRRQPQKLRAP
jgi:hypothetical protein